MSRKKAETASRQLICAKVGTRESKLARIQTSIVISRLSKRFSDLQFEVFPVTTRGDKVQDRPISQLDGRGVFVKELEEALLDRSVDLVVHSLKDLPTELPDGLVLACVLDRCDPRDVVISNSKIPFLQLPAGSRVATSSRRRTAQLKALRNDLLFIDIRGNIPTRLKKHDEGACDAMVLAAAGLLRLDLRPRITEYLDIQSCTPAVGQGALAIECRSDDENALRHLREIEEPEVRAQIACERAFLDKLQGGCSIPAGALAETGELGKLKLTACVAALDGTKVIRACLDGSISDPEELGLRMFATLEKMGAEEILANLRQQAPAAISPP